MKHQAYLVLIGIIAVGVFLSPSVVRAENPEWTVYTTENSGLPYNGANAMAFDAQGNAWIGSAGLVKFDGVDNWEVYTTDNSKMPTDDVLTLLFDTRGDLWIGTFNGLAKFDRVNNWTVYNTDNSGLLNNLVLGLVFDGEGNLWGGPGGGGYRRPAKVRWGELDIVCPRRPRYANRWSGAEQITIDAQGNLWVGFWQNGLWRFDGVNWTEYNPDNSGLPHNWLNGNLAIDAQGNLWIGTRNSGLAKLDRVNNWTEYNPDNSLLPYLKVDALAIDVQGNVWIGTIKGLAVYREGGVILPSIPSIPTNAAPASWGQIKAMFR